MYSFALGMNENHRMRAISANCTCSNAACSGLIKKVKAIILAD